MAEIEPEKIEIEEKDLILVGDILKHLTKTIKTFTTYPPNNPIYQKFSAELFEKISSFFEQHDNLPLKVEHFSMLYKDKEVFYSEDRSDNVTLMLFIDGIREICFYKGITIEEIIDFINVLRIASKGGNLDDDIVTLLWEKDMEHFSYFVPETIGDEELNISGEMFSDSKEGSTTISGASYSDLTVKCPDLNLKVQPVADEELAAIRKKLHEIEGDNLLYSANELFFDIMTTEKDTESFTEIVKSIGMVLTILLEKNMLAKVIELLDRLRVFAETDITDEHKRMIDNIINKAGSDKTIREVLKGNYEIEDVKRYFLFLNKTAIPSLLEILGEQQDRKMRRLICNVLAIIGKQEIETLSKGLKDERWYLVRNILMILGMIKEPAVVKYIEECMRHPEVRVRREAVKSLEIIGTAEIKNPLVAALKDTDSSIRISALKTLRRLGGSDVFELTKDIILKEDFKERAFTEKKEFFETLAGLNKEEAFPIILRFFKPKGWFIKAKNKELMACAAYGLGVIGTKDAILLLEKGTDSKDGLLREACRKAIRVAGKK